MPSELPVTRTQLLLIVIATLAIVKNCLGYWQARGLKAASPCFELATVAWVQRRENVLHLLPQFCYVLRVDSGFVRKGKNQKP